METVAGKLNQSNDCCHTSSIECVQSNETNVPFCHVGELSLLRILITASWVATPEELSSFFSHPKENEDGDLACRPSFTIANPLRHGSTQIHLFSLRDRRPPSSIQPSSPSGQQSRLTSKNMLPNSIINTNKDMKGTWKHIEMH